MPQKTIIATDPKPRLPEEVPYRFYSFALERVRVGPSPRRTHVVLIADRPSRESAEQPARNSGSSRPLPNFPECRRTVANDSPFLSAAVIEWYYCMFKILNCMFCD